LNLVPFTLSSTGIVKASDLDAAIVKANPSVTVSQIFGWDATNQRYSTAYINANGTPISDFTLQVGQGYFVEASGVGTLTMTGTQYTTLQLAKGLNLISVPVANSSTLVKSANWDGDIVNKATGVTMSQIFGWDATNQRYATAYINANGTAINDFTLDAQGSGYFVETSAAGNYQP